MSLTLYWKKEKDSKREFITTDLFLGDSISTEHKIMSLPTISFMLPTEVWLDSGIPDARFEFIITFDNGHIFHGLTTNIDTDHLKGYTTFKATHIAEELDHRRVPTNYAIKELTLGEVYNYNSYVRPPGLGEGEIISNQRSQSSSSGDKDKVTKTGNKTIDTVTNPDGSKTRTTRYEMSDGSYLVVVSQIVKEVYGKNAYKQTTTTTYPNGKVVQTVTTKNGYGSSKTEVQTVLAEAKPKDPPKEGETEEETEEDNITKHYVDISKLDGMFNDTDWTYKFLDNSEDVAVTYLFSNQSKLQALTDICKQTEDVFWRLSLTEERTIEIGRMGQYKQLMINETNLIGDGLVTERDFTTITNYGIYFTDKSDSGTTALTLRDVYNHQELQNPAFPVIMTGQEVNTERKYNYIDLIAFGANNNGDYAVLDTEGVALEAGEIYEEAFTSNDVQTVAKDNKELTDADRLIASRQLYTQAIRKLRHSRRKVGYRLQVAHIPADHNVGDRVRLTFVDEILKSEKCTNYYRKLLSTDDYFYITSLELTVNVDGFTEYSIVVEKFLYNDKEV